MKKGESPKLSAKWWKDSQPVDVKKKPLLSTAGKLDDALKDYEAAKAKLEKDRDADAGDAAKKALDAVGKAADAAGSEAGKIKGNDEATWTAAALKQLGSLIDSEGRWIAENADEDDGMFGDPDVYRIYLKKTLKKLRSAGELNFGVVLGRKPEEHRLAFNKAKAPRALGAMLVRETKLHIMTFGTAMTPKEAGEQESQESQGNEGPEGGMGEERPIVLILNLEGKPLPGLAKKLGKMLKKFKEPFKAVKLMVDGKEVADEIDPNDTDEDEDENPQVSTQNDAERLKQLTNELAQLMQRIAGVTDTTVKGDLARLASQARAMIGASNVAGAERAVEALRNAMPGKQDGASNYVKSRDIWVATCNNMVKEYDKLRAALTEAYKDSGVAPDLVQRLNGKLAPVLQKLNGDLTKQLDAAAKETEPTKRQTSALAAAKLVGEYKTYAAGEPLLADLDENPFAQLKVRELLARSLGALEQTIR